MQALSLGLCHASSVSFDNKAILIIGTSGSGKSSLALRLMASGATLISDDQTLIEQVQGKACASPVDGLEGMIEARHVGILGAAHTGQTPIELVVDLDRTEPNRLPDRHFITVHKQKIDLIYAKAVTGIEYAVLQWIKGGRIQ